MTPQQANIESLTCLAVSQFYSELFQAYNKTTHSYHELSYHGRHLAYRDCAGWEHRSDHKVEDMARELGEELSIDRDLHEKNTNHIYKLASEKVIEMLNQ